MAFALFLKCRAAARVRRGEAFSDRALTAAIFVAVGAACVGTWIWSGRDGTSVAGSKALGLAVFGVVVAALVVFAVGGIPTLVAQLIAAERDRKSLDALLTSRLASAEIVLGKMAAALFDYFHSLAAIVPIVVLWTFLGGIDPRLVLLAFAGLGSTALVMAALGIAVSAGAPTASRGVSTAVTLAVTWLWLPMMLVVLLPRIWPAAAPWVAPVAVTMLDSSPAGVALGLVGMAPRGPLVRAVLRMIALQSAATVVLTAWAIVRLRPASRAVHDVAGASALRRLLRRRWQTRPPCGDDPVFWYEVHATRGIGPWARLAGRLINVLGLGLLAYFTSWFAAPAFTELVHHGYGPTAGRPSLPDLNPIARVLVAKLAGLPAGLEPERARLEFNTVLRTMTALFDFLLVVLVAGFAAESIATERDRDTWLGLLATPLTPWEILRAKMLGSLWRAREIALPLFALWTTGLLAGAVHPLGLAAAVASTVISSALLTVLGVLASLHIPDRGKAGSAVIAPLILVLSLGCTPFIVPDSLRAFVASFTPPLQPWLALLSHDDLRALTAAAPCPHHALVGITTASGSRLILACSFISLAVESIATLLLIRLAIRTFDRAAGRPTRGRGAERGG
jgi:ABC-type transport system involved in multi-copper enzyme maturation permease subunit